MSTPIAISLTVKSRDNKPMNYTGTFVVSKMQDLMANKNEETALTITDGSQTQTSEWQLEGNFREGQVLYYTIETVTGTTRRLRLYGNSSKTWLLAEGTKVIANNANDIINFAGNQQGIQDVVGSVKLTIGGSLTAIDTTLTLTNVTQLTNLQNVGDSQFMYQEGKERMSKYTVSENVAAVLALMNPPSS